MVTGGERLDRPGFYLAPTIVEGAPADSEISCTELFGPITTLHRVDGFEEALAVANASPYGLTAAIWTSSIHRGQEFVRRIVAGGVAGERAHLRLRAARARSAASATRARAGASPEPRRSTSTPTGRPSMSRTIPQPSEAVAAALRRRTSRTRSRSESSTGRSRRCCSSCSRRFCCAAFAILAVDMLFVPRDRGRWLYRERRISRGREFEVLKFRVLREDVLAEVAAQDGAYARALRGRRAAT